MLVVLFFINLWYYFYIVGDNMIEEKKLFNLLRYYGSLNKIGSALLIKFFEFKIISTYMISFYLDVPYLFEKLLPVTKYF